MELIKESLLMSLAAAVIALIIGLAAGSMMDGARTDYIQDQLREVNLETETFLVTRNYIDQSSQNYCKLLDGRIPDLAERNADIGRDLQSFSSKSISKKQEYKYLKQNYYVNQLKLYNILNQYNSRCDTNTTLILFFFEDDTQSKRQGAVLTKYRKEVNNRTYVFSFNLDTEDSRVVEVLKDDWSVENGPSLVLNGNKTFRSYVPLKELKRVVKSGGK